MGSCYGGNLYAGTLKSYEYVIYVHIWHTHINDIPTIIKHPCTLFAVDISVVVGNDRKSDNYDYSINRNYKLIQTMAKEKQFDGKNT